MMGWTGWQNRLTLIRSELEMDRMIIELLLFSEQEINNYNYNYIKYE